MIERRALRVVPEPTAQRRARLHTRLLASAAAPGAYLLSALAAAAPAHANPEGGKVVAGSAAIVQATPKKLEVRQSTDKAIVDWRSFGIGRDETVAFVQPSAGSVTLNRVTGSDPSAIFGTLTANGTVMLVNPNGIVFGQGARVDVGGLVATTANIRNDDFLAGRYDFREASPNAAASVVNRGDITVREAGLAALVAPGVENSGVIRARLGRVALAGAQTFTLDFHGDGLLSFGAGSAVTAVPVGPDGQPLGALVVNSGEIAAAGGTVELTARAVQGVLDTVVNTDGIVAATSVSAKGGRIVLSGGGGSVAVGGTLDASGRGAGETGGSIVADAAAVDVAAGARLDASGHAGGGSIAVGSDGTADGAWAAERATVGAGAVLAADALERGDGGRITVLSDKRTVFAGAISARGGAAGGDGGFAEVSSHKGVALQGSVDLRAPKGRTGTFLLDPDTLRIVAGGGSQDGAGADGTIAADDPNLGAGATLNTISASVLEAIAGNSDIVLQATGLITVDTSLALQTGAGNSFTLQSTQSGGIAFTSSAHTIVTQGGAIRLEASGPGARLTNIGGLASNGGAIVLRASADIQLAGSVAAGAGAVSVVSAAGSIARLGSASVGGASVLLSASAGNLGSGATALATATANLTLETGGDLNVANAAAVGSLAVDVRQVLPDGVNTYRVTGTGFALQAFETGAGITLASASGAGTQLAVRSDRGILVAGAVNVGGGSVRLAADGGALASTSTGLVTAGTLDLASRGLNGNNGTIGGGGQAFRASVAVLHATAGSGGVNFSNTGALEVASLTSGASVATAVSATGNITLGAVSVGTGGLGSLTVASSGGSIGRSTSGFVRAGSLTLSASGAVGSAGTRLRSSATTLDATAGSGGLFVELSGAATVARAISGNGDIVLHAGGSLALTEVVSQNGTSSITVAAKPGPDVPAGQSPAVAAIAVGRVDAGASGDVTLSSDNGSVTSSGDSAIVADRLTVGTGASGLASLRSAAKRLDIAAGAGGVSVMQTGAAVLERIVATGATVTVSGEGGNLSVGRIAPGPVGLVLLAVDGGSILGADGSNLIAADAVLLSASGAIGSLATPLRTSARTLSLASTGNIVVANSSRLLTSLTIDNRHNGATANTLQLSGDGLAFAASDDGSRTVLAELGSPHLTELSYTSDKGLVLGSIGVASGTASFRAASGSILDDGNANTRILANSLTLLADAGSLGAADAPLGVSSAVLSLATPGNLHVSNLADMTKLTIASTHAEAAAVSTFSVVAPAFVLDLTDSATTGYTFANLIDVTGLSFAFSGDRDIRLGTVDLTPAASLAAFKTTAGSILDDGVDTTTVLATDVVLDASRAIGAASGTGTVDVIAGGLSARSGDGGIFVFAPMPTGSTNFAGRLTLGRSLFLPEAPAGFFTATGGPIALRLEHGDLAFAATVEAADSVAFTAANGAILGGATGGIAAGSATVTLAAAGGIGAIDTPLSLAAGTVTASAGGDVALSVSGTTRATLTAGGDIAYTQATGSLTVGAVSAAGGTGEVALVASGGSIEDDGDGGTAIAAGKLGLTAGSGSIGAGSTLAIAAADVRAEARGSIRLSNTAAFTDLKLVRASGSSGTLSIAGNGQTFQFSEGSDIYLQSISAAGLNFVFSASKALRLGTLNVGAGGTLDLASTSGAIAGDGVSGAKLTADRIALAAGAAASIGGSASPIAVASSRLALTAGRNIHVASEQALTHLAVVSTNATATADTASTFAISGTGGPTVSITDDGTTQTVDVAGGSIVDFSFANAKNIAVSEIVATGTVKLATSGGGANSNIRSVSAGGRIAAAAIEASAQGTGAGNGSLGSSVTSLQLQAASLKLAANGDIYVSNNGTTVTALDVTATHKTAAASDTNTYAFSNLGTVGLTVSDAAGVHTLTLASGAGTVAFAYSTDRAIRTGTIDAGTLSSGSVSLTSTGGATGVAGTIARTSGLITAGEVRLSALGTDGNVGTANTMATSTQKLSVAARNGVRLSNGTTLTHLTLEALQTGGPHTYLINATGLTFSVLDNTVGNNGFNLASIAQSGLDLTISSTRSITVSSVNLGSTGRLSLTANGGAGAINATSGGTVVTAADLVLKGSSVGRLSTSGSFNTNVDTLTVTATGSVNVANDGLLALKGVSVVGAFADTETAATIASTDSIVQSGPERLTATSVTLKAGGSVGQDGTPVLLDTRRLTLETGRNLHVENAVDLFGLNVTANHAEALPNTFSIAAKGLAVALEDPGAGSPYLLSNLQDASGLDLALRSDVGFALGTVDVGRGGKLDLAATGDSGNLVSAGAAQLTAGSIVLTSSNAIGAPDSAGTRIATSTRALTLTTGGTVAVDNDLDLGILGLTSTQATGGVAPTYRVTAPNLVFDVTDDGSTAVSEIADATGLVLTLATQRALKVGRIDVRQWGMANLSGAAGILGAANAEAATQRIVAGTLALSANVAGGLGSASNRLHTSVAQLGLTAVGDVYVDSDTYIDALSIAASGAAARTYDIVSVDRAGVAGMLFGGSDDGAVTTLAVLDGADGLDFSFSHGSHNVAVGSLDAGASGSIRLSTSSNAIVDDGDGAGLTTVAAGFVDLVSNDTIGGADAAALDLAAGRVKVLSGGGATLDLYGDTTFDQSSFVGETTIVAREGDLDLSGGLSALGTLAVRVTDGSLVAGSLSDLTIVSLDVSGAIGSRSALSTAALTSTTIFTDVTAGGGVALVEAKGLRVDSLVAGGDVSLTTGSVGGLFVGTVDAGSAAVSLISGQNIAGTSAGNLTTGGKVTLSARDGSIGSVATALRVATADLSLNAAGDIVVTGTLDLADLAIDRTPTTGASAGVLNLSAPSLTWSATDAGNLTTLTEVTDTSGLNFTYTGTGSIAVGTVATGASSRVALKARPSTGTGSIAAVNGASSIAAGTLRLSTSGTGAGIGSVGTPLGLDVASLTASAGTGGLFVRNAGSLTLASIVSGGVVQAEAATGDLTLGGVTQGSGSSLTLTALAGGILAAGTAAPLTLGNGDVVLSAATGIGSAAAPVKVNASGNGLLDATVTGQGGLHLDIAGSVGTFDAAVANGPIDIFSSGAISLREVSIGTDARGNDIVVAAGGNISVQAVSAGAEDGRIVLNAIGSGDSIGGMANTVLEAGSILLQAAGGIGSNFTALRTSASQVRAVTDDTAIVLEVGEGSAVAQAHSGTGQITVTGEDPGLFATNLVSAGGGVTVNVFGGDLVVGAIDAGNGIASLIATGIDSGVRDDGAADTRIAASSVTLVGTAGVGTADASVQTRTANLVAVASADGIFLDDDRSAGTNLAIVIAIDGPIRIATAGPTAALNVMAQGDTVGNDVAIATSAGDLTVTSVVAGSSNGEIALTAAGSILGVPLIPADVHLRARTASLSAVAGSIGAVTDPSTGEGTPIKLAVGDIGQLSATAANQVISVESVDTATLVLTDDLLSLGSGGSAYIRTAGDLDASAGLSVGSGNLLLAAAGTLTLPASGNVAIAGGLTLRGENDVVAAGGGRTFGIAASSLVFSSGAHGGSTTLNTTVGSLDARLLATGALTVNNTGALSSLKLLTVGGNVTATSTGGMNAVDIKAGGASSTARLTANTGNLTVGTVDAELNGAIVLAAPGGSLLTGGGSFVGSSLDLTSLSGIGTAANPFATSIAQVAGRVTGTGDIHLAAPGPFTVGTLRTANGDIAVTAAGDLTAGNTIDAGGNGSVSLVSTGGDVALTENFTNLGGNASGAGLSVRGTNIALRGVATTGTQRYVGSTTVGGALTASAILIDGNALLAGGQRALDAGTGALSIAGTLNGAGQTAVLRGGSVTVVGSAFDLAALQVAAGSIVLGPVTTAGAQTYTGATSLAGTYRSSGGSIRVNGPTALRGAVLVESGGGDVAFGALDGPHALTVRSGAGNVAFGGVAGAAARLGAVTVESAGATRFGQAFAAASIRTDAPGTLSLAGSPIDTTGTQTYSERAVLGGDVTLAATTVRLVRGAEAATAGGQGLTVDGNLAVDTALDGGATLRSLRVGGTATVAGGAVVTTGRQDYGGALNLVVDTTLTGSVVALADGADAASAGAQSLVIVGDAEFGGDVGGNRALGSVAVEGATRFAGGSIATVGDQSFAGATRVAAAHVLESRGGSLVFGSTIDGNSPGDLSLTATLGSIQVAGAVGGSVPLGSLTFAASGQVAFGGDVRAAAIRQTAAGTPTHFRGVLAADGPGGIDLAGPGFRFDGPVSASGGPLLLTATGDILFAPTATVAAGSAFRQIGDVRFLLPGDVTVAFGPIRFDAVAELPAGPARLLADGDVAMPGLFAPATALTLAAGDGALAIGSDLPLAPPTHKLNVASLSVPDAGSAQLFGNIGAATGPEAAYIIDSSLVGPPYFINATPWGPPPVFDIVNQVVATIVTTPPVPSTPGAMALFDGSMTPEGIAPDPLDAFGSPRVLNAEAAVPPLDGAVPEGDDDGEGDAAQ